MRTPPCNSNSITPLLTISASIKFPQIPLKTPASNFVYHTSLPKSLRSQGLQLTLPSNPQFLKSSKPTRASLMPLFSPLILFYSQQKKLSKFFQFPMVPFILPPKTIEQFQWAILPGCQKSPEPHRPRTRWPPEPPPWCMWPTPGPRSAAARCTLLFSW